MVIVAPSVPSQNRQKTDNRLELEGETPWPIGPSQPEAGVVTEAVAASSLEKKTITRSPAVMPDGKVIEWVVELAPLFPEALDCTCGKAIIQPLDE